MQRANYLDKIDLQYKVHSVCGLLGPRQVGKTTLAKQYAERYDVVHWFDLEDPFDLARLDSPLLMLRTLTKTAFDQGNHLIVIDEIQRRPELFPALRVFVDEAPRRILILGSASRDLLQQSSETLAGRIGYLELPPFSLNEAPDIDTLWSRGGFPRSYLADTDQTSFLWRQAYISTFLERDIPQLGFRIPPAQMRRLWMMLTHYHGQLLNYSELGKSLALSHHTIRHYIDILGQTFMIRVLQPWFENLSKRQVKTPKVYIRDSGLFHTLLNVPDLANLLIHPKLGASWEGFALEEIIKQHHADDCYFWGTPGGAELDLLILKNGQKIGFEIKYTQTPKITPSMRSALENLNLDHLYVVFPHTQSFPLSDKVTALGLSRTHKR